MPYSIRNNIGTNYAHQVSSFKATLYCYSGPLLVIHIATKVSDGSVHLFRVVAGFPGGHEVLSVQEFEAWKKAVKWDWDRDAAGRGLDETGNLLFGPAFKGDPGHPNVLSYHETDDRECQLCQITKKKGGPPLPR